MIARREIEGRLAVALERTAFYPTGGGQPNDIGALFPAGVGAPATPGTGSAGVLDVIAEDGLIWHILAAPLAADSVTGVLDWSRRFDHMQQHTGQHILSQAFIQLADAETVAFHLGAAAGTIDLNRIDLDAAALAGVEKAANAVVDAALAVTPTFVTPEALAGIPLRKPPKVTEDIRIVQVAGYDWSACGGTHVANTAQVGLIKVVATERRGTELRVTFLCGQRARADYARLLTLAQGLVARFTTAQDDLLETVDRRAAEMQVLRKELAELEGLWVESTAATLWHEAERRGAQRVVARAVDYSIERAKRVVQTLRAHPGAVVLLAVRAERPRLIFARADDVTLDAARAAANRGGGCRRPRRGSSRICPGRGADKCWAGNGVAGRTFCLTEGLNYA